MKKSRFKAIVKEVDVGQFLSYRRYLDIIYDLCKQKSNYYSYQDFSTDLGIGTSNIAYSVIHQKRKLTDKNREAIISHLGLTNVAKCFFEALVNYEDAGDKVKRYQALDKLVYVKKKEGMPPQSQMILDYFSEWQHHMVLQILKLPLPSYKPEYIAKQLNCLTTKRVEKSLSFLAEHGIIKKIPKGDGWQIFDPISEENTDILNLAKLHHLHTSLDKAGEALLANAPKNRFFEAATIPISFENKEKLSLEIKKFWEVINSLQASEGEGQELVQINIQCYSPVTQK
ncbi:MAG: TIGR02147 family protein [Oligoflexales bacterium]